MSDANLWCRCGHHLDRHPTGARVACRMSGCPCRGFRAEPRGAWGRLLERFRSSLPN